MTRILAGQIGHRSGQDRVCHGGQMQNSRTDTIRSTRSLTWQNNDFFYIHLYKLNNVHIYIQSISH